MVRTALACLAVVLPTAALAESSIARFEGGIGSHPNTLVQGTPSGGQPWVISNLSVDVKSDGRISVAGRGLLLAGGNGIGRTGGQSVRARLFCGTLQHNTPTIVPLDADGDFRIDDVLVPLAPTTAALPASPCTSPVLLIVSSGGNWFAAGIVK